MFERIAHRGRRLGVPARLRLFLQVLEAMQHAQAQLVIHRDIKPANVMADETGRVKLLDVGLAKLLDDAGSADRAALTEQGERALTPQYASPEQIEGRTLGVASDIYSLGVLRYELLTSTLPYQLKRATPAALEEAIVSADLHPPSSAAPDRATAKALRGHLDTIVLKALALDPAERYRSAAALAEDLQRVLDHQPILARPPRLGYRLGKLWQRQRLPLVAAALLLLAVSGGVAATLWQAGRAREEARPAAAAQTFLVDLFKANAARQSDPKKARATTARELLDLGAERIDKALIGQAEAQLGEAVRVGLQAGLTPVELLRARAQRADAQARRLHLAASEATLRAALADALRLSGPAHLNTHQTRMRLGFALLRQGRAHEALLYATELEPDAALRREWKRRHHEQPAPAASGPSPDCG